MKFKQCDSKLGLVFQAIGDDVEVFDLFVLALQFLHGVSNCGDV